MTERIGDRIKKARIGAKLTLAALGKACGGKSPQAVKNWQDGRSTPSARDLSTISDATRVTIKWLLYGVDDTPDDGIMDNQPLRGRVVAHVEWENITAFKNGDRTVGLGYARSHFHCGINSFQTIVLDRANEPAISPGDSVIIDLDEKPQPGDFCLALLDNEPAIRRYRPRGDHIELAPANPDWPTARVSSDAIVGTITEISRPRRT